MKYLSLEEVYAIHLQMIKIGGGRNDIHDFSLLHSAVERPRASFAGRDLYLTIWSKSAALLHSLVKNHPFDDGNKRTAFYSTKRFLFLNGYNLHPSLPDTLRFMVSVDVQNLSLKQISSWLKSHSLPLRPS